jgi:hypothetical protein
MAWLLPCAGGETFFDGSQEDFAQHNSGGDGGGYLCAGLHISDRFFR